MNASKRRYVAAALCALFILISTLSLGEAHIGQAGERDLNVRVLLSRLGITDRMDIVLSCAYALETDSGASLRFSGGSELALLLADGELYAHYMGMSINAGKGLRLRRYAVEDGTEYGFRRVNFEPLYAGDLTLYIEEGAIRPVLSINVEDYLLGVVPYEMSDSFPLEALKAQSVAARTYALRKQNGERPYDLVDTTNDQVFKGYVAGYSRAEKAVAETRGVCGFYKGALAQCYYAASNGGQTERVTTVWPGGEELQYYAFGNDKYDIENPQSVVKSIAIAEKYADGDAVPYGLRRLLATTLHDRLVELGYDPTPESVRAIEISDISLDTPSGGDASKLMTIMHIKARVASRTRTDPPAAPPETDTDTEEVSLFYTAEPTPADSTPETTAAPTPAPTPSPSYGPFVELPEAVELDVPIFPTAESSLALDITSHLDNELWSVKKTSSGFTVEARRYGHGVGMSQRGAQWMAFTYGMKCEDILAFYYPGMELLRYSESGAEPPAEDEALSASVGPAPSPTPRPTLMPSTMTPAEGQWFATVTEIDDDSTLNLRSSPDMSGDVVMRLYKHQRLLVLERCPEEGWVKVQTDAVEGYVVERYLTSEAQ